MSHPEQSAFFTTVADANAALIPGGRVLEVGSYDVNGTIRRLFEGSRDYVGVDLTPGPGVDVISYGHAYDDTEPFDIAISGECFEHDPHWAESLANMARLTRPGGLVAFSCASRGRPEHGTQRSQTDYSPGTQAEGLDYYRNLEEADVRRGLDLDALFSSYEFWYLPTNFDLYFAGVVRGEAPAGAATAQLPDPVAVAEIADIMPLAHRAIRLPLKGALRVTKSQDQYQRVILPYWLGLLRVRERLARRFPESGALQDRGKVG